jgi:KipI family sensor histidine kinase inhibitor
MKKASYASTRYFPFGDSALLIEFGDAVSLELNQKVVALNEAVLRAGVLEVEELVPTYRSLLLRYNPSRTTYEQLVFRIKEIEEKLMESATAVEGKRVTVPVAYGGEYGSDLNYVARYHELTEEQVVRLHSEREYRVYMIGFVAGFPYLGGVPDEIATPRLETPRLKVPAGSVGIAEKQTGIYPCEAPGGWQIIGRTPLSLFNPQRRPPALLEPGDAVRFEPISTEEFKTIRESVLKGACMPFSEE